MLKTLARRIPQINLKTLARRIPQINRLIVQRDDLIRQLDELRAGLYPDEFAVKASWDWCQKSDLFDRFIKRMNETPLLRILEIGSRRVPGRESTTMRRLAHSTSEYVGCDFQAGDDVDVVADAHSLSKAFSASSFDMILTIATYEHLSRPWVATNEIAKVLKPGGLLYIRTHQTFQLHAHPKDYFRFSTEALSLLCDDAGLKIIKTAYEYPASIVSFLEPKGSLAPAYILVEALAEKP